MLLLLPILAPVAGGIFVFRQKKESVRNRLVLALMLVTAGLVCAVCLTPEQTAPPGPAQRPAGQVLLGAHHLHLGPHHPVCFPLHPA